MEKLCVCFPLVVKEDRFFDRFVQRFLMSRCTWLINRVIKYPTFRQLALGWYDSCLVESFDDTSCWWTKILEFYVCIFKSNRFKDNIGMIVVSIGLQCDIKAFQGARVSISAVFLDDITILAKNDNDVRYCVIKMTISYEIWPMYGDEKYWP